MFTKLWIFSKTCWLITVMWLWFSKILQSSGFHTFKFLYVNVCDRKRSMNFYNYLRPKNIECILKIRIYASFKTSDSECICFTSLHNLTSQHLHQCNKNTKVNVFEVWKDLPSTLHNYVTSSRVKRLACCCNENANPNSQNTFSITLQHLVYTYITGIHTYTSNIYGEK